jgi:hypothetical protein
MQAGLHVPTSAFAHLTGPGAEKQPHRQVEMASLWAQAVIACQRWHFLYLPTSLFTKVFEPPSTMSFGGYPSIISFTSMASSSFERMS